MLPEFVDIFLRKRLPLFNIVFLTDRDKLRVIFFNNIVFHRILIHLAVQFLNIGKTGITERALVQRLLHMVLANGAETHFVKGGNIFISRSIIHAAAGGELFFALDEFGVKESVIDIGEGGGGNTAGLQTAVKVHNSIVGRIPILVITDSPHRAKMRGGAADL